MSETEVVVPEGMLRAVLEHNRAMGGEAFAHDICLDLKAALRWLSENPIVPTYDQARAMEPDFEETTRFSVFVAAEWQRRMFIAPEPEPEAPANKGAWKGLSRAGWRW